MLKDRYFYPLAVTLIAIMIWFALSASMHEELTLEKIVSDGYITQGEDLKRLTASRGMSYAYLEKTEKDPERVVLKTNVALKNAASAGIFAALGPEYEAAFANRNLTITIRARQGKIDPLSHFYMGYFTADVGDSGWIKQDLTQDWQDYKIKFTPKTPVNDDGIDYLGVWPGEKGTLDTMEIQSMKIDVIPQIRR